MLSRNKRSVQIALTLMQSIFTIRDVELLIGDNLKILECISSKFKLLEDLSVTLKVPVQELLKFAPDEVCGKITYYLMLCGDTISVLDYFCTFEFYLGHLLPRSWFFLLQTNKITHEKLQSTLLKLKFKDRYIITLQGIRENLYECLVQIAYTSKLTYN